MLRIRNIFRNSNFRLCSINSSISQLNDEVNQLVKQKDFQKALLKQKELMSLKQSHFKSKIYQDKSDDLISQAIIHIQLHSIDLAVDCLEEVIKIGSNDQIIIANENLVSIYRSKDNQKAIKIQKELIEFVEIILEEEKVETVQQLEYHSIMVRGYERLAELIFMEQREQDYQQVLTEMIQSILKRQQWFVQLIMGDNQKVQQAALKYIESYYEIIYNNLRAFLAVSNNQQQIMDLICSIREFYRLFQGGNGQMTVHLDLTFCEQLDRFGRNQECLHSSQEYIQKIEQDKSENSLKHIQQQLKIIHSQQLAVLGKVDHSIAYLQKSLDTLKSIEIKNKQFFEFQFLAYILKYQFQYRKDDSICYEIGKKLSQLFQNQNDSKTQGNLAFLQKDVFNVMIQISFQQQKFSETLEYCEQFQNMAKKYEFYLDQNRAIQANLFRTKGLIHTQNKNYQEAIECLKNALDIFEDNAKELDAQLIDNTNLELSEVYKAIENKEQQLKCLNKCLEIRLRYFSEKDEPVQIIHKQIKTIE